MLNNPSRPSPPSYTPRPRVGHTRVGHAGRIALLHESKHDSYSKHVYHAGPYDEILLT